MNPEELLDTLECIERLRAYGQKYTALLNMYTLKLDDLNEVAVEELAKIKEEEKVAKAEADAEVAANRRAARATAAEAEEEAAEEVIDENDPSTISATRGSSGSSGRRA